MTILKRYIPMLALMLFASCAQDEKYETPTMPEETTQGQPRQILFTTNSLVTTEVETRAAGVHDGADLKEGDEVGIFIFMARGMQKGDSRIVWNGKYGYKNLKGVVQKDGRIKLPYPVFYPMTQEDKVAIMAYKPYVYGLELTTGEDGDLCVPQLQQTLDNLQSSDIRYISTDLLVGLPEESNPVRKDNEPIHLKFMHNNARIRLMLYIEKARVADYERVRIYVSQPVKGTVNALNGSVITDDETQQDILFGDYSLAKLESLANNPDYYQQESSCLLLPKNYDEACPRVFKFVFTGTDVEPYIETRTDTHTEVNYERGSSYRYRCTIGEAIHEDSDPDEEDNFELGIKERK